MFSTHFTNTFVGPIVLEPGDGSPVPGENFFSQCLCGSSGWALLPLSHHAVVPPISSQGLCFSLFLAIIPFPWSDFPENFFSPCPLLHSRVPSLRKCKMQIQAGGRSSSFTPRWAQASRPSLFLDLFPAGFWEEAQSRDLCTTLLQLRGKCAACYLLMA